MLKQPPKKAPLTTEAEIGDDLGLDRIKDHEDQSHADTWIEKRIAFQMGPNSEGDAAWVRVPMIFVEVAQKRRADEGARVEDDGHGRGIVFEAIVGKVSGHPQQKPVKDGLQ